MAKRTYTREELESTLSAYYKRKLCSFSYPGKDIVSGIVDELAVDHDGTVIVHIRGKRYESSLEAFQDCIKILK